VTQLYRNVLDLQIRGYADLASRWFRAMSSMTGVRNDSRARGRHELKRIGRATTSSVVVEVDSTRPLRITLELRAEGVCSLPRIALLQQTDPGRPPISDVCLESPHGDVPLTLRIRIPDLQPAGTYYAQLRHADGCTMGALSVDLAEGRS